ncbi:MAG: CocE/NonD family hydrolase, partial [Bacteroidales bacterium]
MLKRTIPIFLLMTIAFLTTIHLPAQNVSQASYQVMEELDVKVTMRDGVRISTNIYRPDAVGTFPVLLARSPYGNGGEGNRDAHFFASRGYAVVVQDTRGRAESEG